MHYTEREEQLLINDINGGIFKDSTYTQEIFENLKKTNPVIDVRKTNREALLLKRRVVRKINKDYFHLFENDPDPEIKKIITRRLPKKILLEKFKENKNLYDKDLVLKKLKGDELNIFLNLDENSFSWVYSGRYGQTNFHFYESKFMNFSGNLFAKLTDSNIKQFAEHFQNIYEKHYDNKSNYHYSDSLFSIFSKALPNLNEENVLYLFERNRNFLEKNNRLMELDHIGTYIKYINSVEKLKDLYLELKSKDKFKLTSQSRQRYDYDKKVYYYSEKKLEEEFLTKMGAIDYDAKAV